MDQVEIKNYIKNICDEFNVIIEDIILEVIKPKTDEIDCSLGMGRADEVLSEGVYALWECAKDLAINKEFLAVMINEFLDFQEISQIDIQKQINEIVKLKDLLV